MAKRRRKGGIRPKFEASSELKRHFSEVIKAATIEIVAEEKKTWPWWKVILAGVTSALIATVLWLVCEKYGYELIRTVWVAMICCRC